MTASKTVNNVFGNAGETIMLKSASGTRSGASFSTTKILKRLPRGDKNKNSRGKGKAKSKDGDIKDQS